jgi:iron-regulated transporter 1
VFYDELYVSLNGYLSPLVEAVIIGLALIAFLSSMAYKIAIEKDWIVVVASGNTAKLTSKSNKITT